MITGFNTDVRHNDVVFHVQTEDKGTGNPCVETLVYVGGQILARKRTGYQKLLDEEESEKAVTELMEKQHKALIYGIRAGKLDDKVTAAKPPTPSPAAEVPASAEASAPAWATSKLEPKPKAPRDSFRAQETDELLGDGRAAAEASPPVVPVVPVEPVEPVASSAVEPPAPKSSSPRALPLPMPSHKRVRPAVSDPGPQNQDRSLDQVILDYLEMESDQEKLVLSMDQAGGEVEMGQQATLLFRTESSLDGQPISSADIVVRLISTSGEPKVLAEGKTSDTGELELKVAIPDLDSGTAALIVNAESSVGNAEMRRLI